MASMHSSSISSSSSSKTNNNIHNTNQPHIRRISIILTRRQPTIRTNSSISILNTRNNTLTLTPTHHRNSAPRATKSCSSSSTTSPA